MQAAPAVSKSMVSKRLRKKRLIYSKKPALQSFIPKLKLKPRKEKRRRRTQKFLSALWACSWLELLGTPSIKPLARRALCVRITGAEHTQLCLSGKIGFDFDFGSKPAAARFLAGRLNSHPQMFQDKEREGWSLQTKNCFAAVILLNNILWGTGPVYLRAYSWTIAT